AGALDRARTRGTREGFAGCPLSYCARNARRTGRGWTPARPLQIRGEASESWCWRRRRSEGSRRRKEITLDRKVDDVATEKSLQERRACRFPLWESGGGPPHYDRDEARQEIVGGADRVHSDRQIARRFRFGRSVGSRKQGDRTCPSAIGSKL